MVEDNQTGLAENCSSPLPPLAKNFRETGEWDVDLVESLGQDLANIIQGANSDDPSLMVALAERGMAYVKNKVKKEDHARLEVHPKLRGSLAIACCLALTALKDISTKSYGRDLEDKLAAGDQPRGAPAFQFIGVDAASFNISKALLVKHLLQLPLSTFHKVKGIGSEADFTRALCQILYSSIWTETSREVFSTALGSLLSSFDSDPSSRPKPSVYKILNIWKSDLQKKPLARQEAVLDWMQRVGGNMMLIVCNIRHPKDRAAVLLYALTGQMFVSNSESCNESCLGGSVFMGTTGMRRVHDEWVFHFLHVEELFKERDSCTDLNLVMAAELLLKKRMSLLRSYVQKTIISLEVYHCQVSASNAESLSFVRDLTLSPLPASSSPPGSYPVATMAWSNIVDYFSCTDFHKMVQGCTVNRSRTVHYLYSMHWMNDIKGAGLIDYESNKHMDKIISSTHKYYVTVFTGVMDG
eukprot:Nk52_evm10s1315 gene=Nk52_evmTU10s1315